MKTTVTALIIESMRLYLKDIKNFDNEFITAIIKGIKTPIAFIIYKEQANIKLSLKLRKEGVITTPRALFKASCKQEINGLIIKEVFNFIEYNPIKYTGIYIFNLRLINKVKGKATDSPYKKLRLVIQVYNNNKKEVILIQSLIIQRASQRVIIIIALSLAQLPNKKIRMWL